MTVVAALSNIPAFHFPPSPFSPHTHLGQPNLEIRRLADRLPTDHCPLKNAQTRHTPFHPRPARKRRHRHAEAPLADGRRRNRGTRAQLPLRHLHRPGCDDHRLPPRGTWRHWTTASIGATNAASKCGPLRTTASNARKSGISSRITDPGLTSAVWFPLHSKGCEADFICTPAPIHNPDGSESLWCYTRPIELYGQLRDALGHFPLMNYWGPMAGIKSSAWIADSAVIAARAVAARLLLYLPAATRLRRPAHRPR